MFAYEKGLIWGNDNYRTNAALVNVALATGNIGRPGGGCVRMGGHQEGYARPSDAHVGRPARLCRQAADRGPGRRPPHLGAATTTRPRSTPHKFKHVYKKRTDIVKDAMNAVPYGRPRGTGRRRSSPPSSQGGLFAVDVDIVPTQDRRGRHVWLPAATSGEMNLTSMNGERRMRLTERYMDPPGKAMPDCLIAARLANHMERVLRELGDDAYADQFKGFDWKTEEDAFMDGYDKHAKGGEHVTYERLRAMGNNGFQEPAVGFEDGKIVGTKRLYTDGKFGGKDGKATFMEAQWRGLQAPGKEEQKKKLQVPASTTAAPTMSGRTPISTRTTSSSWTAGPIRSSRCNPDDMGELGVEAGDLVEVYNDGGSTQAMVYPTPTAKKGETFMLFAYPNGRAGQRGQRRHQRADPAQLQADLGRHPEDRRRAGGDEGCELQEPGIPDGLGQGLSPGLRRGARHLRGHRRKRRGPDVAPGGCFPLALRPFVVRPEPRLEGADARRGLDAATQAPALPGDQPADDDDDDQPGKEGPHRSPRAPAGTVTRRVPSPQNQTLCESAWIPRRFSGSRLGGDRETPRTNG